MPALRNIKHSQKTVLSLSASKRLRRTSQPRRLQNHTKRRETLRNLRIVKELCTLLYTGFSRFSLPSSIFLGSVLIHSKTSFLTMNQKKNGDEVWFVFYVCSLLLLFASPASPTIENKDNVCSFKACSIK